MMNPIKLSELVPVFPSASVISIAGAGGKTTLMFRLASMLADFCVVTTTTKVGVDQSKMADVRIKLCDFPPAGTEFSKRMWVSPSLDPENGKIIGCSRGEFSRLADICGKLGISVICESDGAACRHIKAPAEHEPVIPAESNICFFLVGLDVLGLPLSRDHVHRTEQFEKITGMKQGEPIDPEGICRLLDHPLGGLKSMPEHSIKVVYLTHTDTAERIETLNYLASELKSFDYLCY